MADNYLYGSDVIDYPPLDTSPGGGYYGSDLLDMWKPAPNYGDQSPGGGYYGSDLVTGSTITDQTAGTGTSSVPNDLLDLLKKAGSKLFFDKDGNLDLQKLATIGGGLAGLIGSRSSQPEKVGYQGSIPTLTAVRERVAQPRGGVPGAGGRRYFSDVQYAAPAQAAAAQQAAAQQAAGLAQLNAAQPAQTYAAGGITDGYYLGGKTDGMADKIPATIDNKQPAKLSHGEFVVPADVVSHLGNGNSEAGAQRLYDMMDRIRKARTGTTKQGKQVNPDKFLPK